MEELRPIAAPDFGLVQELAHGICLTDERMDALLSPRARLASDKHWTPVAVARRAAELLTAERPCRILDVGSGAGKFCCVGALTTPGEFVGVERRRWLVEEARALASALGLRRVRFVQDDLSTFEWASFDGVYLFNPFHENLERESRIDDTVDLGPHRFDEFGLDVAIGLASLREGARVVTYHGLGSEMPSGFEKIAEEPWAGDWLELWVKRFLPKVSPCAGPDPGPFEFDGPCTD